MKKILFLLALTSISTTIFSQAIWKFEKVDSVAKTKDQIYSETKMFIAKNWKSAKDVIQNDDKEAGVILIKGVSTKQEYFMLATYVYVYRYNVTFYMKDNKFKITIDNVYCDEAYAFPANGIRSNVTKIEPFDNGNCPTTGTFGSPGLPKKKAIPMMANFSQELQGLIRNYQKALQSPAEKNNEW